MPPATQPVRVAIVGTGHVGSTFAYALLWSGIATEIVLINRDRDEAEGEAMDLGHAVPFAPPTRVWAGTYADCAAATVVVLTVGAAQGDAASRLDLVERNGAIFREVVPEVASHSPDAVLLVATNPVDVLTLAALRLSGLPPGRVIGSGTVLDTARFQALLGRHLGVDPRSVDAQVIGEHGDSQVAIWSGANVAGVGLADAAAAQGVAHDRATFTDIARQTRTAAAAVADRKGATFYGVAAALTRIVAAIVHDERTVLTVSSLVEGQGDLDGVCLSLPSIVGRHGIERVLRLVMNDAERAALGRSAATLREAADRLDLSAVPENGRGAAPGSA